MLEDLIILVVLIFLNGLISTIISSIRLLELKKNKYKNTDGIEEVKNKKIKEILKNAKVYINVATFVETLIVIVMGYIVLGNLSDHIMSLIDINRPIYRFGMVVVIICVTTLITTICSSVCPKIIASRYPDKVALGFSWLLKGLYVIISPFIWIIEIVAKIVEGLFKSKDSRFDEISEEEILLMIDAGEEKGSIDEDEREMINNIFDFDDKIAGELATHRKDIISLSVDAELDEIIEVVIGEKYTRIPVYRDSIDNIIGILHVKDFMKYMITNGRENFDIKKIIMEPYFVPFTKKADDLFKEMQAKNIHLTIVIDEYGGTSGIVTMEDLIEEIMGNIFDEYDEVEEPDISILEDNSWIIDGTTSLDDVAEQLDTDFPLDDYETFSGFIIGQLGRIPDDGEQISIEYNGFIFKVEKIEERRIVSIKVIKYEKEIEENLE